ncbi:divergent polysaccharide deacetylase family protein [bacterium]|nr:divergent polysaccharide deacetylase family protein [bacterium]
MGRSPGNKQKTSIKYDLPVLIGLILIGIMLAVRYWIWHPQGRIDRSTDSNIETVQAIADIDSLASSLAVSLKNHSLNFEERSGSTPMWFIYGVPGKSVTGLHLTIKAIIDSLDADVLDAEINPVTGNVTLAVGWSVDKYLVLRLVPSAAVVQSRGAISLLIDDFGRGYNSLVQEFAALGIPITISVIPSMAKASTVAENMRQLGCEVMLHLPMEPFDTRYRNEAMLLKTGASSIEIKQLLDRALTNVPGAVGINNHMGSKVTSHRETMSRVLEDIKQRGLFFVDSRTIASSVAFKLAREMNIPCAERQVFIDPEDDRNIIRRQMQNLAKKAAQHGMALGIGHCRRNTIAVLKEEIPRLKKAGYQFLFVSQVVR